MNTIQVSKITRETPPIGSLSVAHVDLCEVDAVSSKSANAQRFDCLHHERRTTSKHGHDES